jgi:hypothetical protein
MSDSLLTPENADLSDRAVLDRLSETPARLLELLKYIARHIDKRNSFCNAIHWIIHHKLYQLIEIALKSDKWIINKIFDPDSKDSDTVSIEAFYGMQRNVGYFDKFDVICLAVLFGLPESDFDNLVNKVAPVYARVRPFRGCLEIFRGFLEREHIPRLFRLLSIGYNHQILKLAWDLCDQENSELFLEFFFDYLFGIVKVSGGEPLVVTNPFQFQVALTATEDYWEDCKEDNDSINKLGYTARDVIFLFFKLQIVGDSQIFDDESSQEIVLRLAEIAATVTDSSDIQILISGIVFFFAISDFEYRLRMLEQVLNCCKDQGEAGRLVHKLFCKLKGKRLFAKVSMTHIARLVKLIDGVRDKKISPVSVTCHGIANYCRYKSGSGEETGLLVPLFLAKANFYRKINFLRWMAANHFLQLREYDDIIASDCLDILNDPERADNADELAEDTAEDTEEDSETAEDIENIEYTDIFGVVRECLKIKAQLEFQDYFFDLLQHKLSLAGNLLFLEDKRFLAKMRLWIKEQKRKIMTKKDREWFGSILALYGERLRTDFEVCLKSNMSNIMWGYLTSLYEMNHPITPRMVSRVIVKVSDWLKKKAMYSNVSAFGFYEDFNKDVLRALMIRFGFTCHPLFKLVSLTSQTNLPRSKLELLILGNQLIDEEIVSEYISPDIFISVKHRLAKANLTEEAQLAISKKHPCFNSLRCDADDPKFVSSVWTLGRRDTAIAAYRKYLDLTEISTAKVQLTAHWFFVDDFDFEIETVILEMFNLASYAKMSF